MKLKSFRVHQFRFNGSKQSRSLIISPWTVVKGVTKSTGSLSSNEHVELESQSYKVIEASQSAQERIGTQDRLWLVSIANLSCYESAPTYKVI